MKITYNVDFQLHFRLNKKKQFSLLGALVTTWSNALCYSTLRLQTFPKNTQLTYIFTVVFLFISANITTYRFFFLIRSGVAAKTSLDFMIVLNTLKKNHLAVFQHPLYFSSYVLPLICQHVKCIKNVCSDTLIASRMSKKGLVSQPAYVALAYSGT